MFATLLAFMTALIFGPWSEIYLRHGAVHGGTHGMGHNMPHAMAHGGNWRARGQGRRAAASIDNERVNIAEEVGRLEASATRLLRQTYARLTPWAEGAGRAPP